MGEIQFVFNFCISFLFLFCCSNELLIALRLQQPKTNKQKKKTNQTNITRISVTCVLSLTGHYFSCFDSLYISVPNDTHQPICCIHNQRASQPDSFPSPLCPSQESTSGILAPNLSIVLSSYLLVQS